MLKEQETDGSVVKQSVEIFCCGIPADAIILNVNGGQNVMKTNVIEGPSYV